MPDLGKWHHTVHFAVGAYEGAKDFERFSCRDWYSGEDGTDYYCREGFGALFVHSARDVDVTLDVTATAIDWSGKRVTVETNAGSIRAKAVVLTVSTGVLASGRIAFTPSLPEDVEAAFHALSMGHYTHVAMQFSENFFGVGSDGYFAYKIDEALDGSPMGFIGLINAAGSGVSYFDLGGEFARHMAREGDEATIDFVRSELVRIFGATVEKNLIKAHVADWSLNPLTLGAYASAVPGGERHRRVLRKNIAGRIWFAGEALSRDDWSTVAGAHKSGVETAKALCRNLTV